MYTLIHVTHEAHGKMGGIGAVLEGLLTARAYQATVGRTILIGCGEVPRSPSPETLETVFYRSGEPEPSSPAGDRALAKEFGRIEATYGVRLLYGRRRIPSPLARRYARV